MNGKSTKVWDSPVSMPWSPVSRTPVPAVPLAPCWASWRRWCHLPRPPQTQISWGQHSTMFAHHLSKIMKSHVKCPADNIMKSPPDLPKACQMSGWHEVSCQTSCWQHHQVHCQMSCWWHAPIFFKTGQIWRRWYTSILSKTDKIKYYETYWKLYHKSFSFCLTVKPPWVSKKNIIFLKTFLHYFNTFWFWPEFPSFCHQHQRKPHI